jgi:predicted ATPase
MLRGKRQELHGRVAHMLEKQWPETAEAQPELLAHHCAQAGLVEQAIAYYARAGQRAVARSAMAEAIAQLTKGLELLTSLPDGAFAPAAGTRTADRPGPGADRRARLRRPGGGGDLRPRSRPVPPLLQRSGPQLRSWPR